MILANYGIISSSGGSSVTFDADALSFITAAAITDTTQKTAISTLVTDLKTYNIWTKMKAIYPFVGGTAASHKWNLKDPRDLDAAYRLVFSGGGTHDSTGYIMNGTDSFASTYFNPSTVSGWKDNHNLSIYLKTTTPVGTGWHLGYGNTISGDPVYGLAIRRQGSNDLIYDNGNYTQNGRIQTTTTDARGFWCGNSVATNDRRIYKNGLEIGQRLSTVFGTPANDIMTIGAVNGTGGSLKYYLSGINSLTSFSDGLSLTELTNLNTAVTTYQTILSRNN
jgi:hypothetical protein